MKKNAIQQFFLVWLLLCVIVTYTCTKLEKSMLVSTGEVTDILTNSAEATGMVVDLGDGATQHGHCYGTSFNVTIAGSKTQLGIPPVGGFTSQLTNLTAGTKYYIKAYMSNGSETVYGREIFFTTVPAAVPTITTTEVTSITTTIATSGGNISSDGGASVTARGVCWNTSTGPSISNSKTTDANGTGSFTSSLTSLTPGTTYYIRSYATNSAGTAYRNELTFTTATPAPVLPTLTTTAITGITQTTAASGGNISSDGGASVSVRGVCWSTSANPTIALSTKTTDGTGTGSFTSSLTGLTAGTAYYVRAYATNSAGTSYGNEVSFTTSAVVPVVPTISTTAITSITQTTAGSGGNITSDGDAPVTARGVCWSTSANPVFALSTRTTDGTGSGSFTSSLTGLTENTTYYVRAYATNIVGTAYGNELTFTTKNVPSTVPGAPTMGTATAGNGQATVTFTAPVSNGGSVITGYTVTSNPGSITASGSASPITVTGLTNGTAYTFTVTATNANGSGLASTVSNSVMPSTVPGAPTIGTATAGNGQATVTFTAPVSNGGSAITGYTVTSSPASITASGSASPITVTGLTNGTAYTFTVTATNANGSGPASSASNSVTPALSIGDSYQGGIVAYILQPGDPGYVTGQTRGLIAAPSDQSTGAQWGCYGTTITGADGTAIGTGAQNTIDIVTYCTTAGIAAKLCLDLDLGGYSDWYLPSKDELNKLYLNKVAIGGFTGWDYWSSTEVNNNSAWSQYFVSGSQGSFTKDLAFYVRAVRAFPPAPPVLPAVSTTAATAITSTSATTGGNVLADGGAPVTARGVCWSTFANPTTNDPKTNDGSGPGIFTSSLTGLKAGTIYYVRAYATNSVGTAYGNELSFTTTITITDIDLNIYNTVQIGTQLWIVENLKVTMYNDGSAIPLETDEAVWAALLAPGYCWYNNDAATYKATYGALYNWYAVDPLSNGGKNVCPTGWHVPTDIEWTNLTAYLGGEVVAGGKLKETGTTHWLTPNTGATNETGFTALPGGYRDFNGTFTDIGYDGNWWSATESDAVSAWGGAIYYDNSGVFSFFANKRIGFSVRCLRDF